MSEKKPPETENHEGKFPSTQWSLILEASGGKSGGDPEAALAKLCQAYWYPLYVFVRRSGKNYHDAQDIVQGFFERILQQDKVGVADKDRGKFRTFLLTAIKNHMASEYRRETAEKRGGGIHTLSIDHEEAENLYKIEPANPVSPEVLFQRRWALTSIDQAITEMDKRFKAKGRGDEFALLKNFLIDQDDQSGYADAAAVIGVSANTFRVRIHRMRRRFRQILRSQIGKTVGRQDEIDDELKQLLNSLSA